MSARILKQVQRIMLICLTGMLLCQCQEKPAYLATGYVSANLTYVSCPYGGYLQKGAVQEGQSVQKKQVIMTLSHEPEEDQMEAARAQWRSV